MVKKVVFALFIFSIVITAQDASKLLNEAMNSFNEKEYIIAHRKFSKIKNISNVENEIHATAFYYSALSLEKEGQTDGAAAEYEEFIREFPVSNFRDAALYNLGILYYKSGNYAKCREKLITLVKDYPHSQYYGAANYWVGEAFISEEKLLQAEEFLLQSIANRDRNTKLDYAIFSLGNLYERKGDFNKAIVYYDELLSYYTDSELLPYAQLRIGISYYRLNDFENAILELTDPKILDLPEELMINAEFVLANAYARTKEYEKSEVIYNEILARAPNGITEDQIKFGLGWVNFQSEKYDEAFKIFNSLIASLEDSVRIKSLYWSAECKRYLGKYEEAVRIYQMFLNLYPDNLKAYDVNFNIGIIYYNRNDLEKAKKFLTKALESPESNTEARALTLLGEIELSTKNYKNAREQFYNAKSIFPSDSELRKRIDLGLAVADYYTNNFVEAIDLLEKLKDSDENFEREKVQFYLAESYFAKGIFKEALNNYKTIPPTAGELGKQALYGLAYTHYNLRDYPNGSYYFKEYLKLFKNDSKSLEILLRLADCYFGMKDFVQAEKYYTKAFYQFKKSRIEPREHFQYGQALFKANIPDRAVKIFRDLQILFPKSKYADDAQYFIGWILFKQYNYNDAISEYFLVPNKYPNSPLIPLVYYSIGDCYFNLGNYEEAITFYHTVINEYPNSNYAFDALNGITYSYLAKNDPGSAAMVIDSYVASYPTNKYSDDILYKKGEIYYNVGNFEMARVGYKEFIATYPKSEFVPDAYYWIGKASQSLGHKADAMYNFQIVVDNYLVSNIGMSAVLELGKLYDEDKNYQKEIELYNKAITKLEDKKGIEEIIFNKAKVLLKTNQLTEAYNLLNNLTVYYEGSVFADKAKIELGLLELARDKYSEAKQLFKAVGEKRKDDIGAEAQFYYGQTLFEQGMTNDAILALVRVRSVFSRYDEWYTRALLKLGECYTVLGDKRTARDMYRAVLKRHTNDEFGKEAKRKLRKL